MFKYAGVVILYLLLESLVDQSNEGQIRALSLAVLQFMCFLAKAQADALHLYYGQRAGTRVRQQLMSSILERILARMNPVSEAVPEKRGSKFRRHKKERSRDSAIFSQNAGDDSNDAVNLSHLTADSGRVSAFFSSGFILLGAPLEILIGCLLLYR